MEDDAVNWGQEFESAKELERKLVHLEDGEFETLIRHSDEERGDTEKQWLS